MQKGFGPVQAFWFEGNTAKKHSTGSRLGLIRFALVGRRLAHVSASLKKPM
jgi:hypothetical protein